MNMVTVNLIKETVTLLAKADEEHMEIFVTEENTSNMGLIGDNFKGLFTMPKMEASAKVKAYADSKPMVALARLVELQKKHLVDFEVPTTATYFCSSYMSSLVNAMDNVVPECRLVAHQYVNEGGVALTCDVLAMRDHVAHKDDDVLQPNTAYNISCHLTLLANAYCFESLQSRLGEVLRENSYFHTLITYATSRYILYFHMP